MQRRTTPLIAGMIAVMALAGQEQVAIPVWVDLPLVEDEPVGCLYTEEGLNIVPEEVPGDGPAFVAAPAKPEPIRGEIKKNSTVYDELRSLGVTAFEADMMTRETRTTFDWRRVRPGQTFDLYMNTSGEIDSLILYTSPADFVRVNRGVEQFSAAIE